MSPEELVARGDAPVKEEFVRRMGRVEVTAVTGSAPPAAGGSQEPAKKKSRNQMKKERKQQRLSKGDLCISLIQGNCKFGASCRFNHDVGAYLDTKSPDLPGDCPFLSTGTCPYGITCRFAGKHRHADTLMQQAQQARQAAQQAEQQQGEGQPEQRAASNGAAAAAAAPTPVAMPNGAAAAPEHVECAQAPASEAASEGAGATAGQQQPGQQQPGQQQQGQQQQGQAQQQQQQQQQQQGVTPEGKDWWWRGDGTLPRTVVGPLPPGDGKVEGSINALDKALQSVLRKGQYDFSRADEVLTSLGINNTRQQRAQAQKQQRRDAREQQQQQQPAEGQQQANEEGKGQEGKGGAAEEGSNGGGSGNAPPAAKRAKVEGGAGGGGPEAAATAAAGAPGASSDAAFLSGLGQSADAGADAPMADAPAAAAAVGAALNGSATAAAAPAAAATAAAALNGGSTAVGAAGTLNKDQGGSYVEAKAHPREKKSIDFRDKLYLAPLTTVGNLPFRRLCKVLGADITCGEMALATNLLQGQASEWALLKRHPSEDCFGVQVCGGYPDSMTRCAQLIEEHCEVDFVDINFGCPIDLVCSKGGGSAALLRPQRMEQIVRGMSSVLSSPLTFKMRKGYHDNEDIAHTIIPQAQGWGAAAVTLHGRTRQQRYSRLADWDYIQKCAGLAPEGLQVVGNGDCCSRQDYTRCLEGGPNGRVLSAIYIARGALTKPWLFTEIKEQRDWDISAGERLDLLRRFCGMGLEHWGSDSRGVETTRRFLLEWLSFLHRYIPVGLLDVVPQQLHWRPPAFVGRNDLETLMASDNAADWVKISEMLLGPAPPGFVFSPKHKANSYAKREGADVTIALDTEQEY